MFDSARPLPSELLHASTDVLVAAVAGGLVLVVFYPLTLCTAAVKGLLAILGLRPSPPRNFVIGKGPVPAKSLVLKN
jgi:uncharacterized membrane protein YgaE (UPF0421/DUF939 family)